MYSLVAWWPTRWFPYHWDGANFVVGASRDLLRTGFSPLVVEHADFPHPPLLMVLVAAAWKVFGESRLVTHAVELPFLPLALVSTYFLGKHAGGRPVGVYAGVLFGMTAGVVSEYGQTYVDLPLAGLVTCALALYVHERYRAAGVFFVLASLVKLPSLTVPVTLLASHFALREKRGPAAIAALGAPLAAHAAWLAYHDHVTGWLLFRPGRAHHTPRSLGDFVYAVGSVFASVTLAQLRWLLMLAAALFAAVAFARKVSVPWRLVLPLTAVVAAGIGFFAFAGEFGLRYGLFLLPPYYVAALTVVRHAHPRGAWAVRGVGGVTSLLFLTTWHPTLPPTDHYVFAPDQDMRYRDMIAIGERAAHYLERHFPEAQVVGTFPESYQVTEPYQGYVQRPFPFVECEKYAGPTDRTQVVYVHPYAPGQPACKRLVDAVHAAARVRFVSDDKWVELYTIAAAPQPPEP